MQQVTAYMTCWLCQLQYNKGEENVTLYLTLIKASISPTAGMKSGIKGFILCSSSIVCGVYLNIKQSTIPCYRVYAQFCNIIDIAFLNLSALASYAPSLPYSLFRIKEHCTWNTT